MRKPNSLKHKRDLPEWFRLSKYDSARSLSLIDWYEQLLLRAMANQLNTWPHVTIRDALKKLYGFASDYPGVRHDTSTKGVLRPLEMRDMVAICIL